MKKVSTSIAYKAHSATSPKIKWCIHPHLKKRWEPPKRSSPSYSKPIPALLSALTSSNSNSKELYYGLWGGKLFPERPPLFSSPAQAAAWSISRFHKDGLPPMWGPRNYPWFLSFVGVVEVDAAHIKKVRLHSFVHNAKPEQKLEQPYWSPVDFYSVNDSIVYSSTYARVKPSKFQEIIETFKEMPCYHSSAGSIYTDNTCPTSCSSDVESVYNHSLERRLSNVKCSGGSFIQIERKFVYLKDKGYCNLDKLVSITSSFVNTGAYHTVVVSVCSGKAETEASGHLGILCVCLDKEWSSLYASRVADEHLWKKEKNGGKRNLIHHHHNYKDGLYELLEALRNCTKLPIHVLFQHPAPVSRATAKTKEGKQDLGYIASASNHCIAALQDHHINSIHFVYDEHSRRDKTSWKGDDLKKLSTSKCDDSTLSNLCVSHPKEVSAVGESSVNHPLFGMINRVGWAKFKMGIGSKECAFSITNND